MNGLNDLHWRGAAGITGSILVVLSIVLGIGAFWLLALGGTAYYVVAAIGLLLTGLFLLQRSQRAIWTFAALLFATLLWAVFEAGLDWWPLAARLDFFFVIGIVLLLPRITSDLGTHPSRQEAAAGESSQISIRRGPGLALMLALVSVSGVSVAAWFNDPHAIAGSFATTGGVSATQARSLTQTIPAMQAEPVPEVPSGEWHAYGRTGFGQRYSPLAEIDAGNVSQLQVAWRFETGDIRGQSGDPVETTYEVTPLKIGDRLFLCTPHQDVIALNATTGAQIWRYSPQLEPELALQHLTCRGLSYQPPRPPEGDDTTGHSPATCAAKLFMPTADGRLVALDPGTGALCTGFGAGGQVDLWDGMPNKRPGAYYSTSPVVATSSLVIVGGTVLDNVSTREQSGVIRAFDIDNGELVWNWDSGNPETTTPLPEGQEYVANSPNSWSISSVDEALGMVYVPMGNQPPDQWGGNRSAAVERFSSSVVALDLATGAVRWVFQTVHHDLWDYDVPSQPSLIDLTIDGDSVPALVQPTKQGELFVLDRRNGEPVLPVKEIAAPQGAARGDHTAATQPVSRLSYEPAPLTGSAMWGATMFDQLACRIAFHRLRYEGRFTPPSIEGSLVYPGNFGVFNWGSVAVDPRRQIAFTTPVYLAFVSTLKPRPDDTTLVVNESPPGNNLPALNENFGAPFAADMHAFLSPLGLPCQAPPWGYVAGADLTSGEIVWKHRNGTVRDLSPIPLPFRMGVPSLGGPIITAGGVAFLSGTLDYFVRAYDIDDGRQLWESRLPAGGQATPMTYLGADGRQYLVVVAGGHGSTGTKAGDSVIAYALPKSNQ